MFSDRSEAGRQLGQSLRYLQGPGTVVLGLPRGGVPVAAQVAGQLGAPLDVIVVRKLGVPWQPELGMGAIGEDGVRVLNPEVIAAAGVSGTAVSEVEQQEQAEVTRRARRYRGGRPRQSLDGRIAVIVDDGIATGSTARAACQIARVLGAARVVLAVPVAPAGWQARIGDDADELVSVATPEPFYAIGQFYQDFSQTTDAEVTAALAGGQRSLQRRAPGGCDLRPGRLQPLLQGLAGGVLRVEQEQAAGRAGRAQLHQDRLEQQVSSKRMLPVPAEHDRDRNHPGQRAGAEPVQEHFQQAGVAGLVGGTRDDDQVTGLHRGDQAGHCGVRPVQQRRAGLGQVDAQVSAAPGQPLGNDMSGFIGARARLRVPHHNSDAHRRSRPDPERSHLPGRHRDPSRSQGYGG